MGLKWVGRVQSALAGCFSALLSIAVLRNLFNRPSNPHLPSAELKQGAQQMRRMLQQVQGEKEAAQGALLLRAAESCYSGWKGVPAIACRGVHLTWAASLLWCAFHMGCLLVQPTAARLVPILASTAGFASALEMQLEGLQDRLAYLQLRRSAPAPPAPESTAAATAAAAAAQEAQQLRRELAAAQQQNRTLRAAAARLSKALTAVIQRAAAADASATSGAAGVRSKVQGGGGVAAVAGAAAEVLAQLTAVEGILGEVL